MKIIRIELNNFRQFIGKNELVLSTDEEKNITFVMGENGSGKTTIIEAFRFLFLGKTRFNSEQIINRDLSEALEVGKNYEVSVAVDIEYNKQRYEIRRNQKVSKSATRVTLNPSSLHITYKDKNGKTQSYNEIHATNFIRKIMPEDLFDYFFFRGEDIGLLGVSLFEHDIRQNEFAKAIKNLLGFTYLFVMQNDLEKTKRKFDTDLKEALQKDENNRKIQNEIITLKNVLEKLEKDKNNVDEEIEKLDRRLKEVNIKLSENKSTTEMQTERQNLKKSLETQLERISKVKQEMFKAFSESGWYLFASKLFDKALSTIENEVINDEGIPGISIECLNYIFEHKKCICGNEIIEGGKAFETLKELKKLIPPESIGKQISQFKDKVNDIKKRYNLVYDNIKRNKEIYNEYINEKNIIEQTIEELDKKLENVEDMSSYAEQQRKIEQDRTRQIFESGQFEERIKNLKENIKKLEDNRNIKNDNVEAKFIEKCILYTERVAEILKEFLNEKQETMRQTLEDKINEIHKSVFNSSTILKLRDDYSLLVTDDHNNDLTKAIGQGGAESTIIAFAFIGAVMSISQKVIGQRNEDILVDEEIEPYPFVLDAPASTMDKRVISTFFEKMPTFAEQTLILTKDTDGDYIEKILKDKIGKRYAFERKSVYNTKIIGG